MKFFDKKTNRKLQLLFLIGLLLAFGIAAFFGHVPASPKASSFAQPVVPNSCECEAMPNMTDAHTPEDIKTI